MNETRLKTLTDQSFDLTQRVKTLEVACMLLSVSVICLCAIGLKGAMNGST